MILLPIKAETVPLAGLSVVAALLGVLCPAWDQISLDGCLCFCSSLRRLTSWRPHLALAAHVSIHLHEKGLSLARRSCFIGHRVKQAIICYQQAEPRRSGSILDRSRTMATSTRKAEADRRIGDLQESSLACRSGGGVV